MGGGVNLTLINQTPILREIVVGSTISIIGTLW